MIGRIVFLGTVILCAPLFLGVTVTRTLDAQPRQGFAVAFVNVNVVPMDSDRVLANQTVVVRGDRIVELGPASRVRVADDVVRIQADGRYLMPGLVEMHAHIPAGDTAMQKRVMLLFVAAGVTTIRGMQGSPDHLALRARVATGDVLGPRIYTAGPQFSRVRPDSVRVIAEEQRRLGYDLFKVQNFLSRDAFDTLAAIARALIMPLGGHIPWDVGLGHALNAGFSTVDHLDGYFQWLARPGSRRNPGFFGYASTDIVDESRMPEVARRTRAAGAWVVPTQSLLENFLDEAQQPALATQPGMEFIPPAMAADWSRQVAAMRQGLNLSLAERFLELRRSLIRTLQREGVGILLGSDAPQVMNVPGFSIHKELAGYVRAGLSPFQAVQTGTIGPARYFGTEAESGTVAVGKKADLILLDANPLADIRNVARQAGVMVRGRWLDKVEIARRLAPFGLP